MWVPVVVTLLSGWLSNETLTRVLFLNIGGFPINVMDFTLGAGLLFALFARSQPQYRTESSHPLLWITVALYFLATAVGVMRAFTGPYTIDDVWLTRNVRHYLTLPLTIILGYTLVRSPRGAGWYVVANVLSGIGSALMVGLFFRGKSEDLGGADVRNINLLRTVAFNVSYCGLGIAILLYIVMNRLRYVNWWLAWTVILGSSVGVFLTLSRSDWIATIGGVLPVFVTAPKGERGKRVVQVVLVVMLMAVGIFVITKGAGAALGGDFAEKMSRRLDTLNPFADAEKTQTMAWDTRLPGMIRELQLWSDSPVIGQGFGVQTSVLFFDPSAPSMRHNAFTSVMAETGTLGLVPVLLTFGGMIVLGRRLIRERASRWTMLIGAFSLIAAYHEIVKGFSTMSWNNEREAMIVGFTFGIVMRATQIQKALRAGQGGYLLSDVDGYVDPAYLPAEGERYAPAGASAWHGGGVYDGSAAR